MHTNFTGSAHCQKDNANDERIEGISDALLMNLRQPKPKAGRFNAFAFNSRLDFNAAILTNGILRPHMQFVPDHGASTHSCRAWTDKVALIIR
jgi:hypothetical protein